MHVPDLSAPSFSNSQPLSLAINYAKQSYDWRWEHCKSYFTILPSQGKFVVDYKVTTPACSYDLKSSNLEYIRTPWHVLRCTLESVLQVGRIYNLLEDKMNARSYLINGRSLSSMLNLPLFQASFSCELGKLFRKQHQWDNAKRELDIAQSKLNVIGNNISCLKCKLLLEASIKQERGDLSFDIFKSSNQSDVLNNAKDFYRDAEEKLNHYEWENDVSSPKDASENITMFCDTIDMPTDVATRGRARNCWHCQFSEVTSSSVKRSIKLKWECIRRRLWLRVLIGRGKCYEALKEIENESKVLLYSVSVLVSRSTFQNSHFNISSKCLTTLISHNWMGAGIEPAAVLYQLCCFYLKCINDKDTKCIAVKDIRDIISMSTIVLGLKLSFILSREVPTLFKKVSQLLAALYTIFPSRNDLMLTSTLTESQLGSYFHQACIGTHFNHMFVSRARKLKGATIDGSCTFNSTSRCLGSLPQRVKELENFIMDFFKDLPRITVVCMSFLDDDFKKLLGELLPKTDINRWIMLSRLHSDDVPVSIILPIKNIIGQPIDFKIRATESNILEGPLLTAYGVVPEYKRILEAEEHIMKIGGVKRDNNDRKKLDNELIMFLSHIQSSWFGIWKNMLLGERSDDTELNLIVQELKTDLKDLLGLDIEESILKVVIECGCDAFGELQCLVEAILTKGCYTNGLHRIDKYSKNDITSVDGLIKNACQQTKVECSRKPVILVVDYGIQVLPLESMPILRKKEVYRMPSVTSIVSTLSRRSCYKHGVVMRDIIFPSINPTNAYYLLNVSGDLEVGICKSWFENFQMEGAAMTKPPVEELKLALETHDLFIYISHGHGLQYIPPKVFREIDNCAATLLMGCSSGALEVRGSLAPVGAPLYYLMGGCPAVFCNLWNVVDIEMVDFANELFHGWLNATKSHGYAQRGEDESDGDERSFKKRKIVVDPVSLGSVLTKCREISSEQYLPYLTGAALVCYGVPTFLKKSDVCNAIK